MSATKTYRINEIFYSLQGEGYHTGMPAVFVRFSGCNLRCPFCDTDFAEYQAMTADEIVVAIGNSIAEVGCNGSTCPLIVLTGGEPSLQIDADLLRVLRQTGMRICIETNGTQPLPEGIDWVTCSPKAGTRLAIAHADELKVVLTEGVLPEQWAEVLPADHLFLQPCSCQNTDEVIAYILQHPRWRLSLQTHKYLAIR